MHGSRKLYKLLISRHHRILANDRCPKCGGPMEVIERLTAAQLQLRSPPLLVTTAA